MPRPNLPGLNRAARIALMASCALSASAFAQDPPALTVSPGKATMLVGETRTFRAVGKDGRARHNVRWSISPQSTATLTLDGDEATVQAKQASSTAFLTASVEGESAEATIEILQGNKPPTGTLLWSVPPIPGCKSVKLSQAVPTATGPDLYDEEACPQGTVIRALTADGREIWRRQITGSGAAFQVDGSQGESNHGGSSQAEANRAESESAGRMNLKVASVCDAVSSGMTKDEVYKLASSRNLHMYEKQRQSNDWELEEEGSRCAISFDAKTGAVVKKKKTVVID
jgi:hypothetical protein